MQQPSAAVPTPKSICIVHPGSQFHDPRFAFGDTSVNIGLANGTVRSFGFDRVLGPGTPQDSVYREASRAAVLEALDEVNPISSAFITFGASGSGKTYAVTGGAQHFADRGLIPRSITAVFEVLSLQENRDDYKVSVSFFETYKDYVIDLLAADEYSSLDSGVARRSAPDENTAFKLLFEGDSKRKFEEKPQSPESSPGHVTFVLYITRRGSDREASLAFFDLSAQPHVTGVELRGHPSMSVASSFLDLVPMHLQPTWLRQRRKEMANCMEAVQEASLIKAPRLLVQLLKPWLRPSGSGISGRGAGLHGPCKTPVRLVLLHPIQYMSASHDDCLSWLRVAELAGACFGISKPQAHLSPTWASPLPKEVFSPKSPHWQQSTTSNLWQQCPVPFSSLEPAAEPLPGREAAWPRQPMVAFSQPPPKEQWSAAPKQTSIGLGALDVDDICDGDLDMSPFNWWARLLGELRQESESPTAFQGEDLKERRKAAWGAEAAVEYGSPPAIEYRTPAKVVMPAPAPLLLGKMLELEETNEGLFDFKALMAKAPPLVPWKPAALEKEFPELREELRELQASETRSAPRESVQQAPEPEPVQVPVPVPVPPPLLVQSAPEQLDQRANQLQPDELQAEAQRPSSVRRSSAQEAEAPPAPQGSAEGWQRLRKEVLQVPSRKPVLHLIALGSAEARDEIEEELPKARVDPWRADLCLSGVTLLMEESATIPSSPVSRGQLELASRLNEDSKSMGGSSPTQEATRTVRMSPVSSPFRFGSPGGGQQLMAQCCNFVRCVMACCPS
ncbi:unnamed protein product [Polarella glacialis]|uniref:Kinesin motor domain-containing protein n=1 Tax=Polarella glacialis TaxID=89957 RepID=A0A813LHL8_POLGL|nr:unnamed protein product [Polarella glacialis]